MLTINEKLDIIISEIKLEQQYMKSINIQMNISRKYWDLLLEITLWAIENHYAIPFTNEILCEAKLRWL